MLPDPFWGMRAWRNSRETKQPSHTKIKMVENESKVKIGSSAKDGVSERLSRRTIEKIRKTLQSSTGTAKSILVLLYPA